MTEKYQAWLQTARAFHDAGRPHPLQARAAALNALRRAIAQREARLLDALASDLGKPPAEAFASEVGLVQSDIDHALRELPGWMRPKPIPTPWILQPASSQVIPTPRGVALILGPWNYPVQLLFSPMVAALAAGNAVCLKPSELAPATSAVIADLVRACFPPEQVAVFEGGADTARALADLPFDHIFFTGGTQVGREVMRAAAAHLTPVTLELGGKCPCIVCPDARLPVAAKRIAWAKFLNAGQTCVAPDHVLAHASIAPRLVRALADAIRQFYGDDPARSPHYGRIVNARHFQRVRRFLAHGTIASGGRCDEASRYIEPTILTDPDPASDVMREEIFGPVLPVIAFESLDAVLDGMRRQPKPLALYLFAEDPQTHRRTLEETLSGGVCINGALSHLINKNLPFGGVGESGFGQYHGKAGFDCFTHYRGVVSQATWIDPGLAYPPPTLSLSSLKRIFPFLVR